MTASLARAVSSEPAIEAVTPGQRKLALDWRDGGSDEFHYVWLRDNCPCPLCLHPNGQRLVDILDLSPDVAPRAVTLGETGGLSIVWEPDGHESRYAPDWLRSRSYGPETRAARRRKPILWDARLNALPEADWPTLARSPAVELRWLGALLDHGFALLHGVPKIPGMVADVGDHIGFVRTTNYGRVFDVISRPDPNNLAYTALALGVHTDNPYRDPTPGYQLLHCLLAEAAGGDTLLVDGFTAAERMREEDPRGFDLLAQLPRPFRFADDACDLRAHFPIIGLDAEGSVREIHFNNRSAAPLDISGELVEPYTEAYRRFARILVRPELTLVLRLEPGDLLVLENGRALHGRSMFDPNAGARHLQGCYVDKDGVESRHRVLARAGEGARS
ncbi:MAG TPA: TauD/TfdA family dioxygenase [Alphaproteobacteria bacterium]|nr:TauD/TfdA family dioxygenase [Alphaproteobacteria bacterium]